MNTTASSGGSSAAPSSAPPMAMHAMKMYLHFTAGDTVLFDSVAPSSAGAVFGTCLVFFVLALANCWLRAYRRGAEKRFAARARRLVDRESAAGHGSLAKDGGSVDTTFVRPREAFVLSNELARSALHGFGETLHYLLMLVVMTFNASYIISVILGGIVGEFLFGRLHRD